MIRVALADDHPEVRLALRLLLRLGKDMDVVCVASSGQEALDCVLNLQPDVLVIDMQMPELDGFSVTKQIVELSLPTRVLIVSLTRGNFIARKAAGMGAKGFLAKDDLAVYLLPAIEAIHRGELFFKE
jgi:DNA-binding NarL/FixJ family response regulator